MAVKPRKSTVATDFDIFASPGAAPSRGVPIEDLPRTPEPPAIEAVAQRTGGGIKTATRGTTLYLLPEESRRLKHLATDLEVSVHELVLMGLDRLLAEHGQPPIRRYRR
jgi:hypothetical protein